MPAKEVPTVRTPVTLIGLWNACLTEFEATGTNPTRTLVLLALAQITGECGLDLAKGELPQCYNFSIGNKRPRVVKGVPIDDWCHYGCGEELPLATAEKAVAQYPGKVRIIYRYQRDGVPFASVKFAAPCGNWTRFRAFQDLRAAMRGQLLHLRTHANCWAGLLTGDVHGFAVGLRADKYFTADVKAYERLLRIRLGQVTRLLAGVDWGDVPP